MEQKIEKEEIKLVEKKVIREQLIRSLLEDKNPWMKKKPVKPPTYIHELRTEFDHTHHIHHHQHHDDDDDQ